MIVHVALLVPTAAVALVAGWHCGRRAGMKAGWSIARKAVALALEDAREQA